MSAIIRPRGLVAATANAPGANRVMAELQTAFSGFREQQTARMDRLETSFDEINAAIAGLKVGGDGPDDTPAALREGRMAFTSYLKTGKVPQAAMTTDSNPDGGYTVDRKLADQIQQRRLDMSPLGRLARREQLATGDSFDEPWDVGDIGASWAGEREARTAQSGTTIDLLKYPLHEIFTLQSVTQRLLDDSRFDVGAWLEAKITDKFGRSEGAAFVSGDGVNKPRGLLSYTNVANASWAWGKIGYIASGIAAAISDSSITGGDALINVVYSLRAPYRANARWLMNTTTAATVRKLKTLGDEKNYIWRDSLVEGQPPTLLGYPVEIDEEMPSIGAGNFPIAFGDFSRGYIVIERPGMRLLRDQLTNKPYVDFYAYRRVGGGVNDFEAVKLLKIATS